MTSDDEIAAGTGMVGDDIGDRSFRDVDLLDANGFIREERRGFEISATLAPVFLEVRYADGYQVVDHGITPLRVRNETVARAASSVNRPWKREVFRQSNVIARSNPKISFSFRLTFARNRLVT